MSIFKIIVCTTILILIYTYNFDTLLSDWCSLGLYDVLPAMQVKYNQNDFRAFYKKALAIDKLNKNTAQTP